MVSIPTLLDPQLIFLDVSGTDGPTLLRALADRIAHASETPATDVSRVLGRRFPRSGEPRLLELHDGDDLYHRLLEREGLGSTGIGSGVAVPHCKLGAAEKVTVAVAVSRGAINFGSLDGAPVRVFFVVISPENQPAAHLQTLAAISRWVQKEGNVQGLVQAESVGAVLRHFGIDPETPTSGDLSAEDGHRKTADRPKASSVS